MIDKLKCGRFITDHGFAENYNAVTGEGLTRQGVIRENVRFVIEFFQKYQKSYL